jgi:hypothetical protein
MYWAYDGEDRILLSKMVYFRKNIFRAWCKAKKLSIFCGKAGTA